MTRQILFYEENSLYIWQAKELGIFLARDVGKRLEKKL